MNKIRPNYIAMTDEFKREYNFKYPKPKTSIYDHIDLINRPNRIHSASISDEELIKDIEWCHYIIETAEENDFSESHVETAENALINFNLEMQQRWWMRLKESSNITPNDILFVTYLVYRRHILGCEHQKEYTEKSRLNDTFLALEVSLYHFKELKGL